MKQIPILFSTPMVQAILAGRKTVTRRTRGLAEINKQGWVYSHSSLEGNVPQPAKKYDTAPWYLFNPPNGNHKSWVIQCPYGQPGDILWVRETWAPFTAVIRVPRDYHYKASKDSNLNGGKWKPSIHMPKTAARIWLEVVSVKVERLQDITYQDVKKEGLTVPEVRQMWLYGANAKERDEIYKSVSTPVFKKLWQEINGSESWNANPWVWVVEFKRAERPASI